MTTNDVLTWLNDRLGENVHVAVTHPEKEPIEQEGVLSYEDPHRTGRFDPSAPAPIGVYAVGNLRVNPSDDFVSATATDERLTIALRGGTDMIFSHTRP